jgi:hypothetical protein
VSPAEFVESILSGSSANLHPRAAVKRVAPLSEVVPFRRRPESPGINASFARVHQVAVCPSSRTTASVSTSTFELSVQCSILPLSSTNRSRLSFQERDQRLQVFHWQFRNSRSIEITFRVGGLLHQLASFLQQRRNLAQEFLAIFTSGSGGAWDAAM